MNDKELKEFKKVLRQQRQEVQTSKEAARKLLSSLGLLTAGGDLKKSFKPSPGVSR